ncbi:MAG: beta-lactamase [bacterium]|nr:beta-lactamase [bacterium]
MRTLPTIAAAGSLVAAAFGCGPMTELGLVKPKPSTGGIVHQYTESGDGGHANVYWFDTQAGPIVVDVPLTQSEAKKMRKGMIRPYRIYITEADPVRFGGLPIMKNPDVPAYTTPAIATEIQTHGDQRLAAYRKRVGDDVATHVDAPSPAIEERTHDMIGEVEVELLPLGPAAAESSLAVFIPKTGELITGDVVAGKEHLDLTWGRSKVWQDRIAELKALEPRLIYPGHGATGGAELLEDTLTYLKTFHDIVASKVKQGAPAKISKGDATDIKRQMMAKYPKLGRSELLDRSIPAEYAVQLAELAPAPPTPDQPGATPPAAGTPGATSTSGTTAAPATTSSTPSTSTSSSDAAGLGDLLGSESGSSKSKKKKGKK